MEDGSGESNEGWKCGGQSRAGTSAEAVIAQILQNGCVTTAKQPMIRVREQQDDGAHVCRRMQRSRRPVRPVQPVQSAAASSAVDDAAEQSHCPRCSVACLFHCTKVCNQLHTRSSAYSAGIAGVEYLDRLKAEIGHVPQRQDNAPFSSM